jgi:hypothetical protein
MRATERLLLVPCLVLVVTGCRGIGTQRFTAFAPSQGQELAESSRVVLDGKCAINVTRADYSLCENLHMLAPMPKRWKFDMTLSVDSVVKGEFGEQTLQLHWLRNPTQTQSKTLGIPYIPFEPFTNGMALRIGFSAHSDQHFRDLKILIRQD